MNYYNNIMIRFFLLPCAVFFVYSGNSFAQQNGQMRTNEPKISESITAAITGSIFGAIFGVATSWLTTKFEYTKDLKLLKEQLRLKRKEEIQREISRLRLMYLSPLRLASEELIARLQAVFWEKGGSQPDQGLKYWFTYIKNQAFDNPLEFRNHANGQAHFAATTIYLTAVYFAHSVKIREYLPFTDFPKYNEQLIENIEAIREAWSGEFALWQESQDSIGKDMIKSDGTILTYREFCEALMDSNKHPFYLRLIDYYRDFDLKHLEKEVEPIKNKLNNLISFLKNTPVQKSLDSSED